jgi:hypothetical protein
VVNNKIYVIGGTDGAVLDANEVYDPATNSWASKRKLPTARRYLAAAVVNDKIYAIGGATNVTGLKTNTEYDPATDSWTSKANMPTARMWLAAQGVGGKVYAMGGYNGSASLASNEAYDPATNSWTTKAAMPSGTDSMASAVLGNRIYLVSGFQGSAPSKTVTVYDVLNNAYTYYASQYRYDPGMPAPLATAEDEASGASPLASGFNSGWITFDLKSLVQEWVDGVRSNNGIVIHGEVGDQFSIASRESGSRTPQLVVTY